MNKTWKQLPVSKKDLQLRPTLGGGQSFRWKNIESDTWIGVFKNKVWTLSQSDEHINYECHEPASTIESKDKLIEKKSYEENLRKYFRLDVDLNHYYKTWSESDTHFEKAATKFYGVRILDQDVTENIFSFICSSNNNIKRISSMVEKLCKLYGDPIINIDNQTYYSFPTVEKLTSSSVESDLRNAGFGYRAKFIYQSACKIKELGGSSWLESLKSLPYENAKKELMNLPGIGAKVADCVCLMSLGHLEAVPVDTHIFQVARDIHLPHLKKYKTCSDKAYREVADHYRSLYGSLAGWAQTVLFCSDLKTTLNPSGKRCQGMKEVPSKKLKGSC